MAIAPTSAPTYVTDPYAFQTNGDLRESMDVCEYQCTNPTRLWHNSSGKGTGDDGSMSFSDFLDVINPLQHLPVISTIYRAITGDEPGLAADLAGGALYGGPLGLLSAGINAMFEGTTGKTDGQMLTSVANALFGPGDGESAPATAVAQADTKGTAPTDAASQVAAVPAGPEAPAAAAAPETKASAAATTDAPHPAYATARPFPAFTAAKPYAAFTADPRQFPARPGAGTAAATPGAQGDAESQRIAASVAAQQRAQLGLIMANMNGSAAPGEGAAVPPPGLAAPMPESPGDGSKKPYLPIASGSSITPAAMQQALDRYRRAIAGHAPAMAATP